MRTRHTELCHMLSSWGKWLKCPEPRHPPLQNGTRIPCWVVWELSKRTISRAQQSRSPVNKWPLLTSVITTGITKGNHTRPQRVCPKICQKKTSSLYGNRILYPETQKAYVAITWVSMRCHLSWFFQWKVRSVSGRDGRPAAPWVAPALAPSSKIPSEASKWPHLALRDVA